MDERRQLVVFALDGQRYGLYLSNVERVVAAVEITPLTKAPEIVLGIIDVHGQILPVLNLRKRLGLAEREIALADQLIVAHTGKRPVALAADRVMGLAELPAEEVVAAETILSGVQYVEGVARLSDGMILIHDLGKFLSLDEEAALAAAI
ncbi:MAG: chemotaxis protein CheW [Candidatus Acidiferrales bacterium]